MTRKVFLVLLALVVTLSVGLVACGGAGEQEEEEEEPETYDLTISSTEGGSVVMPGEGTSTYDDGTVVNLVAEPEEGYRFENWTGDVDTVADANEAATTITVDSQYSITANFARGPAIPPKNPDSFVQMIIGDVETLDPAWAYDVTSCEQVQYIYETLLFYDGEEIDQFVPVLATEWEWNDADLTWRFKIRDGVKFHEGGDLTPSDVEYSFERAMVQNEQAGAYIGPIWMLYQPLLNAGSSDEVTFADIDGAVEVDGEWVVFHLCDSRWTLLFLYIVCNPWTSIVDKEWCVSQGDWDGTEGTWLMYNHPQDPGDTVLFNKTNGTGPWKLEEWDPGLQVKLVRNDDYWREPAPFETVITQFVEEWSDRKEALLAGDADLVDTSLPCTLPNWCGLEDTEELEGIVDLNIYQNLPILGIDNFCFNFDIVSESEFVGSGELDGDGIPTNFFSDIDVRKGFCYAFDYETFIEDAFTGGAQQLGSPVCEGLPYFNPDASMYTLDLAKAEEHLKAAWAGDVWEKGFKFTLLYVPGRLRRETACKILADNLYEINPRFQISIQPMDWETYKAKVGTRQMPMFQIGWPGDWPHPDNFVAPFMASYDAFPYLQGYGYPELDQLIENAFKELDPAVQEALYYEIQERYYEDAPSIMLCQLLQRRYFTKYIEGFYYNPMIPGAGPLYYMSKSES